MKMRSVFLISVSLGFTSFAYAKDVFLDVRTPQEFQQDHIPEAINIDVLNSNFKTEVAKLNHDDSYKVYCRTGRRSGQAIAIMKDLKFKHLENLGGLEDAKQFLSKSPALEK
ncbi:MAG: rhodanese-like domain-containing protein [Bdellovibrio sp.]